MCQHINTLEGLVSMVSYYVIDTDVRLPLSSLANMKILFRIFSIPKQVPAVLKPRTNIGQRLAVSWKLLDSMTCSNQRDYGKKRKLSSPFTQTCISQIPQASLFHSVTHVHMVCPKNPRTIFIVPQSPFGSSLLQ